MRAAKHTPGPWAVETEPYFHVRVKDGSQGGWGSTVFAADCASHADCWLIAAAPDLYDALDKLQDVAVRLVGAVLSKDPRAMLLAANDVNTRIPAALKTLRKARGDAPGVVQS